MIGLAMYTISQTAQLAHEPLLGEPWAEGARTQLALCNHSRTLK